MKRASLLVLFACAYLPSTARAQVQTGTPPLGTFSGVPDIVDVANLNSHVTIPVLSKQGRGIPFVFLHNRGLFRLESGNVGCYESLATCNRMGLEPVSRQHRRSHISDAYSQPTRTVRGSRG